MIDTIIGALTGGVGTGVLGLFSGLVGGIVTSITNFKMAKLKLVERRADRKHDLEMSKQERLLLIAESEANIKVEKEKTLGKEVIGELEAWKESQKKEPDSFQPSYMTMFPDNWFGSIFRFIISLMFACSDVLKKTARPVLTYYIMGLATYITVVAHSIMKTHGLEMTAEQAYSIFMLSAQTVLYLAVTSYSWWFCDRRVAKFMAKKLENIGL